MFIMEFSRDGTRMDEARSSGQIASIVLPTIAAGLKERAARRGKRQNRDLARTHKILPSRIPQRSSGRDRRNNPGDQGERAEDQKGGRERDQGSLARSSRCDAKD